MKLNFWQILGLIIFVIALIFIAKRELTESKPAPVPPPADSVPVPATAPGV